MLQNLLERATPFLFFTGKGGVGKTSVSSAVALELAERGARVLLVSTDPASNLSEVLGVGIGSRPSPVPGTSSLYALDIDPMAAAAEYRERVVGPYRGVLPDAVVGGIEEQLSGSCTVEIAAFDQFTGLLADRGDFDHVVFDTAPTGHTLRMLALPGAWTGYLDTNQLGVTCVGPLSGLTQQRDRYRQALRALADPVSTTLVLVTRPEPGALEEASRASQELRAQGVGNQRLVVNGVYPANSNHDALGAAMGARQRTAIAGMAVGLASLPREQVPLTALPPLGVEGLRNLLRVRPDDNAEIAGPRGAAVQRGPALDKLVQEICHDRRGLVMTVGKGGVGKTTVAAAIAMAIAERGIPITLTTTDPAANLTQTVAADGTVPGNLAIERVDPGAATLAYTAEVLETAGAGMDESALAVLREDLRSPCTEEVAVFKAFAMVVARAESGVVVLDTAPSGHTLLLLDAAQSYARDLRRQSAEAPPEVESLLRHLADPAFTRVLVITLAEPTPIHEATSLQADLLRAGIRPRAWVVNQSLLATATTDPLLQALAGHEARWIEEARSVGGDVAVIPWQPEPPIGPRGLAELLVPAVDPIPA